jgi:hypothetical protein
MQMQNRIQIKKVTALVGSAAFQFFLTVIAILNVTSGIAGGIWLIVIGHWQLVVIGFFIGLLMPWVYSIVTLPGTGLGFAGIYFTERKKILLSGISIFIANLYVNAITAIWVIWVFGYFILTQGREYPIPLLLWGYTVMIAPLAYMAGHEPPENVGSTIGLLFAQLSYFICIIFYFVNAGFAGCIYLIIILNLMFTIFMGIIYIIEITHENGMREYESSFFKDAKNRKHLK